MITYQVIDIKSHPDTGGVFFVYWLATLNDNSTKPNSDELLLTQQTGSCNFTPDPSDPNYTPFEQLTQEQVLGWVKSTINIQALETEMIARHEAAKNPASSKMPWMA